jgi:copper(I)-binding protein
MSRSTRRDRAWPRALAALAAAVAAAAAANDYTLGTISVEHPHARATAPGQPVGGGYLAIVNRGPTADRLVGASAPTVVQRVEVHEMRREGDVMRMREVGAIALPPGRTVRLEPGGLHLMLMGLKAPLAAGQRFPMTLMFEKAGSLQVEVGVEADAATPMPARGSAPMTR